MSAGLASAKLHMPLRRQNSVVRPQLIEKLDRGLCRPARLILVSAPAGFGKTTLLAEWLISRSHPPVEGGQLGAQSAWVTLDETDNDPVRFWTYVILALQSIQDEFGESILAGLRSLREFSVEMVPALLIEEMSYLPPRPSPVVLVLEDYHVITNPLVHTTLAFLVEHLPSPQTLCVAICTRADPPIQLARLRAQEELIEIRAADLRFTLDEATLFLHQCGGLELSPEEAVILQEKTEGWVAGLQMAALSVQGRKDTLRFVQSFSGTHHYILDYLVEQVLDRQPENVQAFLLETSILQQLSGPLCDAVTDQPGTQALLERLERANLFLVPLDAERHWYRYHRLFRDLLFARLKQTQLAAVRRLHTRAAEWYERNGLFAEAINHFRAAEDFENAARLIEHSILPAVLRGELITALGWVSALSEEIVRHGPWLCIYSAWALALASQTERVESLLQVAEREISIESESWGDRAEVASMLGQIASLRAYSALLGGNVSAASEQALTASKYLQECNPLTRSIITFVLADTYQMVGDLPRACETLSEVIRIAGTMDNPHLMISGMLELAYLRKARGQLRQAYALYQDVLKMANERGDPHFPMLGTAKVGIGDLFREWNDIPSAIQWISEGVQYNERRGSPNFLAQSYLTLARVLQVQGDLECAFDALAKAELLIQKHRVNLRAVNTAKALRVRLGLAQGGLTNTLRWMRENPGGPPDDELSYLYEPYTLARARVLLAQGKTDQALDLLTRLRQAAQEGERVSSLIEILAVQALAWRARNDLPRALTFLERALLLAQSGDFIRVFLDEGAPVADLLHTLAARTKSVDSPSEAKTREYVDRLLNAFGSEQHSAALPVSPQPLAEPLSDRELQVLRLLAEGLSNREITQKLTIALGTVKAHVHTIYGKLGVQNRIEAIARARDLDLL